MSLALFSLADASVSQIAPKDGGKKPPPKRTVTATSDPVVVPEPR
jgi:hypothetical protein